MPKKAATPKKTPTKSKKDDKKSLHQEFADIIAGVTVDTKKPERKVKEVDRFDLEVLSLVPKAHRETVFEEGTGETLRDINSVRDSMRKHDGDDHVVKKVHQLLYNRPGKLHETKKNIMRYNGLTAKGRKEGKERFHSKLTAWKLNDLRAASKLFTLDSRAPKEELVDALVEFLSSPTTPKVHHETKKKKTVKKKATKKKTSKKSGSESEGESSAAESSAADSESASEKEPRGRKRRASPSPKPRGKKGSASPAAKKRKTSSRSTSRSRSASPAAKRGRTPTKKAATPTKGRSRTPSKKSASPSPKRKASPSPKRKTPTKKAASPRKPAARKAAPKKKAATGTRKPAARRGKK